MHHFAFPFQHIAKPQFTLYASTIARIREFQEKYPDVTIEECSIHLNRAIMTMIEQYESNRSQQALEDLPHDISC